MKTFKDLEFKPHPNCADGTQARMEFDNGYGVSVITGSVYYTGKDTPYELAVLKNGELDYDHPEAEGDVRGYLTERQVEMIMKKVQETKNEFNRTIK